MCSLFLDLSQKGKGLPTTTPPTSAHGKLNHLWWGRIPIEDLYKHVLIIGIGLSALGKLDGETIKLAAQLEIPHHEGAGGEEDFTDKDAFQKHIRRVSKWTYEDPSKPMTYQQIVHSTEPSTRISRE